jgi:predicted ATPase/class 3 adenylate cyclase/GAF domain-containing protein/tRNA A-37 threonylcarbamoyl transferase component Bud32
MRILDESKVVETLHKGNRHTVYKYIDKDLFALKSLHADEVDQDALVDFNLEYDILHKINIKEVPTGVDKARYRNKPALLYNFIEGDNLAERGTAKWTIEKFLPVAIVLVDVLAKIHQENIVHNDIKPENVIIDHDERVYIIDFSSASRLSSRNIGVQSPSQIRGSIAYMSPEAFGRMNRQIDNRSDLYSLGVMFYEMLLGKLPFESKDPLELIHFHMAMEPDLGSLPSTLAEIIGKLLAKTPEQRYQSALGLKHDLQQCQELLDRFGQVLDFPIAKKDFSTTLRIPQKLYGRQMEVERLKKQFDYIASGQTHLLLVSGYSGVGKTALINEVQNPVTEKQGYFLSGKFDQYQRDVPYYALIRAFEQFVDQLLKEPSGFILALRNEILDAVGVNGQLIVNVIPAVELIIGPQTEPKLLPPTEAQNRFVNTFLNFIKVFGKKSHPLVIMVDDLQWSDQASLDLISNLLLDESADHILIIGAYRSNEVDENHPLMLSLNKLKSKTEEISELPLSPLKAADVLDLVSDTLNTNNEKAAGISDLIFSKTNGNPFFVTQFLNRLYDDELIRFDAKTFSWQWEVQVIKALEITDNVVELMTDKLKQLPDNTKEIIRLGACIGNTFDLNTIAAVAQKDKLLLTSALWPAVEMGLIYPEGSHYRMSQVNEDMVADLNQLDINTEYQFAHDRIQQAAYALINVEDRDAIHLKIGRLLLDKDEEVAEGTLFEIMGHINSARSLITDEGESIRYAQLNLKAGQKAKRSLAYDSALIYLNEGIEFCPADSWNSQDFYPIIFELLLEAAEANYLTGSHEVAEGITDTMLQNAANEADKSRVYLLRGLLNTTVGRLIEALDAIKQGLKIFGLEIPDQVDQALIGEKLVEIEKLRAGRPIEELINLPENEDVASYMKILFLAIGATPAFFLDKTLWVWVIAQMVQISIEDGNTDLSDLGYSAYGLFIGSTLGQYGDSYEFGKLALELNKKNNKTENLAKIGVIFGQLVSPWKAHIRENIEYAREGFKAGIETGDLIYAGYCAVHLAWDLFLIGMPLREVGDEVDKILSFFERSKDGMGDAARVVKKMVTCLSSEKLNVLLGEDDQHETRFLAGMEESYNKFPLTTYQVAKMRLHYYHEDYDVVVSHMPIFLEHMHSTLGSAFNSEAYFFNALSIVHLVKDESDQELLGQLDGSINQLKTWSEHAPMNYGYKYDLVLAEKAWWLDRDRTRAEELYEKAARQLEAHGFTHDEALCLQLLGQFYLDQGRQKIAKAFLVDAVRAYDNWGAHAVSAHLIDKYPDLLAHLNAKKESSVPRSTHTSAGASGRELDWATLLKATSVLSSEIVLDRLLDKFMEILIENAGAQKCFIVYKDEQSEQFFIEAETSLGLGENKILHHVPLQDNPDLSAEIIQYVLRTGKALVIDDARLDRRFKDTPYVVKNEPKSILATDLVMQNRPSAIIYMENNLATGAFPENRVEFIRILATQVGISLENALVYRDLEEKVSNRTQTIEKQKEIISAEKNKSDDLLYNILPKATADELKKNGFAVPKYFEEVTILFTDFVGFTKITENLTPDELIEGLNQCFLAFDEIVEKNKLEKIKTIGDSYMCASGVPAPNADHAMNAVRAGLQIQSFIDKWNQQRSLSGKEPWPLRLGIHSGPVIAGVVGMRKFAYDIWGDAVNIASRLESSGEGGRVNISSSTYMLVKDLIEVEYRGKVVAKNKGEVDMFFVKGLK